MRKKKNTLQNVIVWLIVACTVFPFLYVILGSFQNERTIMVGEVSLLPTNVTLRNYVGLLTSKSGATAFGMYLKNSFIVSLGVAFLSLVIAIFGAYGLSRYQFKGKELIAKGMLFMYVFPTILTIVPIYNVVTQMGLIDTHLGLILVETTLVAPFCTWLLRSFIDAIPREIEDAARVDGANRIQIIVKIILPLCAAGLLAAGMYALIYSWGEYTFSAILLNSSSKKTIPLALAGYMSHTDQQWGRLLTGCSLNFIPLLIIFVPFSKIFLKGFMAGAVKS